MPSADPLDSEPAADPSSLPARGGNADVVVVGNTEGEGDTVGVVVVSGFARIVDMDDPRCDSPNFVGPDFAGHPCLRWYAPPHRWLPPPRSSRPPSLEEEEEAQPEALTEGEEGHGGSWGMRAAREGEGSPNIVITLNPPARKDFWRKTYYDPVLVKDDGPFLFLELDASTQHTVEAAFTLTARSQFDQAGILVRIDHEHWIKTGIEVVDEVPRLSCVVTNSYSDWSTQPWNHYQAKELDDPPPSGDGRDRAVVVVAARVRVHCRQTSFVVEAYVDNKWEFIRICHLSRQLQSVDDDPLHDHPNVKDAWQGPPAPTGTLWAGVFGACPLRAGAEIEFHNFSIVRGSEFDHGAT
jgi:regulation of enolase protein 1 (concanavalin A-like superfamily)